jgi:hypothetical protein
MSIGKLIKSYSFECDSKKYDIKIYGWDLKFIMEKYESLSSEDALLLMCSIRENEIIHTVRKNNDSDVAYNEGIKHTIFLFCFILFILFVGYNVYYTATDIYWTYGIRRIYHGD